MSLCHVYVTGDHLLLCALCDVDGNLIIHRYVEMPKEEEVYWTFRSLCPVTGDQQKRTAYKI